MALKKSSTVCFNLKQSWQSVARMYNTYATPEGETVNAAYVLLAIKPGGELPSTHIGPLLGMEASSLTRQLKALEDKGLIERNPSAADRRQVIVRLTERGREKREEARRVVRKFNEEVLSQLGAKRMEEFLATLAQIKELAESHLSESDTNHHSSTAA